MHHPFFGLYSSNIPVQARMGIPDEIADYIEAHGMDRMNGENLNRAALATGISPGSGKPSSPEGRRQKKRTVTKRRADGTMCPNNYLLKSFCLESPPCPAGIPESMLIHFREDGPCDLKWRDILGLNSYDYYSTLFYAMGFSLAFASCIQLFKICYYEMPKNKEKLENINRENHINHLTR